MKLGCLCGWCTTRFQVRWAAFLGTSLLFRHSHAVDFNLRNCPCESGRKEGKIYNKRLSRHACLSFAFGGFRHQKSIMEPEVWKSTTRRFRALFYIS